MILGEPLECAIRALASCCDGARTNDNAGFSKFDAGLGLTLARMPFAQWSEKHKRSAWLMLHKYKGQLSRMGIEYAEIPEPTAPPKAAGRRIWIADRVIRIAFPYAEEIVKAVRTVHEGRWWDGANTKHWCLHAGPSQAYAAAEFGSRFDFDVDDAVKELADNYDPDANVEAAPGTIRNGRVVVEADRLAVTFEYDEWLSREMSGVTGASFHKAKKAWYAPLTPSAITGVWNVAKKHKFGGDTEQLEALAQKMQVFMDQSIEASKAESADLEIEGLGGEMRPYQKAGALYAIGKERCFIADDPGLGKTIEALAVVQATSAYPVLVVCMKSVKLNWLKEGRKWLPGKRFYVVGEMIGRSDADVVIINFQRVKKTFEYLASRNFKAIIVDESQNLKGKGTQQTIAVEELVYGVRYGKTQDGKLNRRDKTKVSEEIPMRLFLSGTPLENRPEELIPQLRTLGRLAEVGGEYRFKSRFIYGGSDGTKALYNWLRATCLVRRLKSDVLKELPDKQRTLVPVPISNRREYQKAEADLIRWLEQTKGWEKAERARRAEALVRIGQLKQLAARGKLEAVKEWLDDFMEGDKKIVIAAWHREIMQEISTRFKCPQIHGGISTAQRQRTVDEFQEDPSIRMVALQIKVIGITLTAASDIACLELGWNDAQMDQIESRCHRFGQHDSVNSWWFVGEKTIDIKIAALIEKKRKEGAAIMDGEELEGSSMLDELIASLLGGASTNVAEVYEGSDNQEEFFSEGLQS